MAQVELSFLVSAHNEVAFIEDALWFVVHLVASLIPAALQVQSVKLAFFSLARHNSNTYHLRHSLSFGA